MRPCRRLSWTNSAYVVIVSTIAILLKIARFCSTDTLELCGDIFQPGGQLDSWSFSDSDVQKQWKSEANAYMYVSKTLGRIL